jgi:hypothetical protein
MLYDSTKNLLLSILRSLEAGDETRWDDQTESGNACLYEMHQMSGPAYKAYRSDSLNANSAVQSSLSEKVNRAMPYVRTMVIAIRHKDQTRAIESGKAALAEMNGARPTMHPAACGTEPRAESRDTTAVRQDAKPGRKAALPFEGRRTSRQVRAASGK